jgi:hypothetical protein
LKTQKTDKIENLNSAVKNRHKRSKYVFDPQTTQTSYLNTTKDLKRYSVSYTKIVSQQKTCILKAQKIKNGKLAKKNRCLWRDRHERRDSNQHTL